MTSALKVSGLTGAVWFFKNYAGKIDPGPIALVFMGGIAFFIGGEIGSLITSWTYASNYNNQLKRALRIPSTVKVQPTVSFFPVNGAPGFMMGMNVNY